MPRIEPPKAPVAPDWIHKGAAWHNYAAAIIGNPPTGVTASQIGTPTPGSQTCVAGTSPIVDFLNKTLAASLPNGAPPDTVHWQVDCSQPAYEVEIGPNASDATSQHYAAFVTFQPGQAGGPEYVTYWVPYGAVTQYTITASWPPP